MRPCGGSRPSFDRSPSRTSGRRACRRCCPAAGRPGLRPSARRGRTPTGSSGGCPARSSEPWSARTPRGGPGCSTGSARPSISNRITPGTSVRFDSPHAAGPAANDPQLACVVVEAEGGGEKHQRHRENERDRDRAAAKEGPVPSTSSIATQTIAPFSTSEPRPKVSTVRGSIDPDQQRPEEAVEQHDQGGGQQSAAPKLGRSIPGSSATATQKTRATRSQRTRPRTAIPATRRMPGITPVSSLRRRTGTRSRRAPAPAPRRPGRARPRTPRTRGAAA